MYNPHQIRASLTAASTIFYCDLRKFRKNLNTFGIQLLSLHFAETLVRVFNKSTTCVLHLYA